jgi:alkylation response protein AidB-like acyl-CoA dehydrogenase
VHRLTNIRSAQIRTQGTPGPESAIGKLVAAELNKEILAFTMNVLGPEGTLYTDYAAARRTDSDPRVGFVAAPGLTVGGGTSEIMRNVIAERTLGLPGDVRVDRDVPFRSLSKN